MNEAQLRRYAELAVRIGVNVQEGQPLVIGYWHDPVLPTHAEFARLLVEAGYAAKASFVHVDFGDELYTRETVRHGDMEHYKAYCEWKASWAERMAAEGAAFLRIPAGDPGLFQEVDQARVGAASRIMNQAFDAFNFRRTSGDYSWSLVSAATQPWADKVHPELPPEDRMEALWADILSCARATGADPVSDWNAHRQELRRRAEWLNQLGVRELHYEAPGTDLWIGLPEGNRWSGGGGETNSGIAHVANIPTEEVFTAPHRARVRGVVSSTMPLNLGGSLIEGIRLRFEEGRIVEYSATKGQDALRNVIELDDGSHYLGEVALVPVDSPISERGTIFYNTLFDENASCHLAIGKAYPLIEGGRDLARSEWLSHGLNDSLTHTDFMIGSEHLNITAVTMGGQEAPIFRRGRWAD